MQIYHELLPFCKELVPQWRKTQRQNLALLTAAIFTRRSLVLSDLARSYPAPQKPKVKNPKHHLWHRLSKTRLGEKRLRRFLDNSKTGGEALFVRLTRPPRRTRLSYSVCQSPGMVLPILLDLTYFEPYAALVASVPRAGRALPIAWRAFRRDLEEEPELSQNHIIERMVREIVARLAPGIEAVLVGDREFAIAAFLLRRIYDLPFPQGPQDPFRYPGRCRDLGDPPPLYRSFRVA